MYIIIMLILCSSPPWFEQSCFNFNLNTTKQNFFEVFVCCVVSRN